MISYSVPDYLYRTSNYLLKENILIRFQFIFTALSYGRNCETLYCLSSVCFLSMFVSVGTLFGCVDIDNKYQNISVSAVNGGTLLIHNHCDSEMWKKLSCGIYPAE